jgi:hypothetical protein
LPGVVGPANATPAATNEAANAPPKNICAVFIESSLLFEHIREAAVTASPNPSMP